MPVTTRSQSRQWTGRKVALKDPKSSSDIPPTSNAEHDSQSEPRIQRKRDPITPKGHRLQKRAPPKSRQRRPSQKLGQHTASNESQQASPSANAMTHWGCRFCDCPQGSFRYPVHVCIRCKHSIEVHDQVDAHWDPNCEFVCERAELVSSILEQAQQCGLLVIRATPQIGKTTLLRLLGLHILREHHNLEPIYVYWQESSKRGHVDHSDYLAEQRSMWQRWNADIRPREPNARTIYLIDEAQRSYEEEAFWDQLVKSRNTRSTAIYVLVCVYGAMADRKPGIESQSLRVDDFQRIELGSPRFGRAGMLFKPGETATAVEKWAISNQYTYEDDVPEYLQGATDGHPGMVGMILQYFQSVFPQLPVKVRENKRWSTRLCHSLIVETSGLLDWFTRWGRGMWTVKSENDVRRDWLSQSSYKHIKASEMKNALREVATKRRGYSVPRSEKNDVFSFCHKMGFLHTEYPSSADDITYRFASQVHRRVAFRRLCPGPDPNVDVPELTLREICINAIARFSPSVIRPRTRTSQNRWGIPEAAFQDEMYSCLAYELHNLPVFAEYAHGETGRIDFFIFEKKWGIEILQNGGKQNVVEHASGFAPGGKYHAWGIFEDYAILNFCPKTATWQIDIPDFEARNHLLNVIIDSEESCAEIYTHDWELLKPLFLAEGKQRYEAIRGISEDEAEDETEANDSGNGSELHQLKGELTQARQREEEARQREEEARQQKVESDQEVAHLKRLIEDMQRNKDQKSE